MMGRLALLQLLPPVLSLVPTIRIPLVRLALSSVPKKHAGFPFLAPMPTNAIVGHRNTSNNHLTTGSLSSQGEDVADTAPSSTGGDAVTEDSNTQSSTPKKTKSKQPRRPLMRLPILRYQNDWVCINKPAGMTVYRKRSRRHYSHIPSSQPQDPVVTTTLKRQLSRKVFPVHRLDHRTSGALLLAFDSPTAAALHQELKRAEKVYVALLRGHWDQVVRRQLERSQSGEAQIHVAPYYSMHENDGNEESSSVPDRVVVDKPLTMEGVVKQARTVFRKLAMGTLMSSSSDDSLPCTLVLVLPQTGRTHQIRRHSYHMGMPCLGDSEHGDSKVNRWCRTHANLNRLALHCFAITSSNDKDVIDENVSANDYDVDDDDDDDDVLSLESGGSSRSTTDQKDSPNRNEVSSRTERIEVIAPLPEELRQVLQKEGMQDAWRKAVEIEPRLETEFYDFRGGTLRGGSKKEWQQKQQQQQQLEQGQAKGP